MQKLCIDYLKNGWIIEFTCFIELESFIDRAISAGLPVALSNNALCRGAKVSEAVRIPLLSPSGPVMFNLSCAPGMSFLLAFF